MKKYKVVVERRDEYEIEIDENKFDEEWKEAFESVFYDVDGTESIAEHLAKHQARFGENNDGYIEGFGYVTRTSKSSGYRHPNGNKNTAEGLNIIIVDEDNDISCEVDEIE